MTYLLTEQSKQLTWSQWIKMGGCELSHYSSSQVRAGLNSANLTKFTLGEIQGACIVAGREVARFGMNHLRLEDWAVQEVF